MSENLLSSNITSLFIQCGFPLRNSRWSWGARTTHGILLRTWTDEVSANGKYVPVLRAQRLDRPDFSLGFRERVEHLRALWGGDVSGYLLMVTPEDESASPRTVRSFDTKKVTAIRTLAVDGKNNVWAELGEQVDISDIQRHAAQSKTSPSLDVFPTQATSLPRPQSNASYVQTLPKMRRWLIEVARRGGTVSYAEARAPFGLKTFEHRHAMDRIGHQCVDSHEPILTSLIVDDEGVCSPGFFKEFGVDDAKERRLCYEFWCTRGDENNAVSTAMESIQQRAVRFGLVAQRPDQARFRQRVFIKWGGKCVVTGCAIVEALDAAHREGRSWMDGHNEADDGYLMRKDIHALYDRKLLTIGSDGKLIFDAKV